MNFIVEILGYFNTNESTKIAIETTSKAATRHELLQKRKNTIGSKCQLFYKDDPFIVSKASMQYIYDETGRKYIDCISNVQHVGHCHPAITEAITKQLSLSTCNTRFVSEKLAECAEEILRTLPGLDTVLFCNSGSEANDLALRLARDFTKHTDVIVVDHAYHGHITSTMQMSPYKFDHGSTVKKPEWVHVAPCPDAFRGCHRLEDSDLNNENALIGLGKKYSLEVKNITEKVEERGATLAAYFSEALQSCGGQVIPPPEYFADVAKYVRHKGGLMVIDEVQTGFARVGKTFWAHQLYDDGFLPDIVTMGKPMGNGFPVSAVVTRKEIADALDGNAEYFNTYGGNPVACAAVLAVIKTLKSDGLIEHTQRIGKLFECELRRLQHTHQCIGDIRGIGLFWGIDIVKDRTSREPNARLAAELILKLRKEHGVLLNADGPHTNIIKIKPPLCFTENDLHTTINAIDNGLRSLTNEEVDDWIPS